MKYFAITPDSMDPEELLGRLDGLRESGVSFLYLRAPWPQEAREEILPAVNQAGMLPLVPFGSEPARSRARLGIHFKSSETGKIEARLQASSPVTSAACHDFEEARSLLGRGVPYIFVSPVFEPLSKPMPPGRGVFPRDRLRELVQTYGERVVALGGLQPDRIEELKREMKGDFSVAGITLFFGRDGK